MNEMTEEEKEIFCALKDSGMCQDMLEETMNHFRSKEKVKLNQILISHRSKLLTDIHVEQNRLYCLDFLIRKFKSSKKK